MPTAERAVNAIRGGCVEVSALVDGTLPGGREEGLHGGMVACEAQALAWSSYCSAFYKQISIGYSHATYCGTLLLVAMPKLLDGVVRRSRYLVALRP